MNINRRIWALHIVAANWRLRNRLPLLTASAIESGLIKDESSLSTTPVPDAISAWANGEKTDSRRNA